MLVFLGTNQAWSVFVKPLRSGYGFSAKQMQFVFSTGTFSFCVLIIIGGRLHDKLGPRPLAAVSAVMIGGAWAMAWLLGESYFFLWLSVGVLASGGSAIGYICPIATAIKWFPNRRGLVSGLAAAGFGSGPILLSAFAEGLMGGGWRPSQVFGFIAVVYAPIILLSGMAFAVPPSHHGHAAVAGFKRRTLFRDRRFWALFAGMFTGTLPYLVVMGNAKPLALDFGLTERLAALAIGALALGNTFGRLFWGVVIDRIGPRRSILIAQAIVLGALLVLIALGAAVTPIFFLSIFVIGFCYGSNFAIYPATVARLYGAHVLGSVYPLIMLAQAFSAFAPTVNGALKDATGSPYPGLVFALVVTLAASALCFFLSRAIDEKRLG